MKAKWIFLAILALVLTFFLSGVLIFVLNKASWSIFANNYSPFFIIESLMRGYPKAWQSVGFSLVISSLISAILPFLNKQSNLFGNARFANSQEVKNMNLFGAQGIIIGKYNKQLLRFGGQQFVALGAPTRSGKGVGIVIPNLMEWQESAVVQDIKQECFDYTSKYRKEKLDNEVFLFNPFSRRTHRYNPLTYIDMNNAELCDNQLSDFATILYPLVGDSTSQFFNQQAQNLFIGLCYLFKDLSAMEAGKLFLEENSFKIEWSLFGILQLSKGFSFEEDGKEISGFEKTYKYLEAQNFLSSATTRRIGTYVNIDSANTRSGVMSSFNAPLSAFESETLRLATQESDFDLRDLRKKKMTIYIGITPDQLANAKLILNIFWSQLISLNTKELPQRNKELKHTVLLVMDEFTAPGQIQILQTSVSFIAGYNLRLLMIYQSKSQLETQPPLGYGKEGAKTLLTNHACQIFYAPREQEDAEAISKILGNQTVKQTSRSFNSGQGGGSSGRNVSETQRALMLPQELREMPFDKELITIDSGKPILCNKAFYYNDAYFMDKFKEVSPDLAQEKGIPNRKTFENAVLNDWLNIEIPTTKEK